MNMYDIYTPEPLFAVGALRPLCSSTGERLGSESTFPLLYSDVVHEGVSTEQ